MRNIVIISVLLLTGCSAQQMAQMQAQQQMEAASIENQKKQYCADMGAPEGSPNYYLCRRDIETPTRSQDAHAKFFESLNQQEQRCESYESFGRIITECN